MKFKGNFPTVPVDDIAIHPRENDLILGTHGRSIWILDDITPLEQLTKDTLASPAHLFDIRKATMFSPYNHKGSLGHKFFVAPNPAYGATISYYLRDAAKEDVKIAIQDSAGQQIRELKGPKEAGIHRLSWDMRYGPPEMPEGERVSRRFRPRGPFVLPGEYKVTLNTGGKEMTKTVKVEADQRVDISFEDRKAQHDAMMSIYKLQPAISSARRALDSIRSELGKQEGVLKKIPEAPKEVLESIKAVSKEVIDIRNKLQGDPSLGRRARSFSVAGRISTLSRAIGGYPAAPSEQNIQKIKKNAEELKTLIGRINKIIEVDIPKLNEMMNKHNIPRIFVGKKIKIN